MSVKKGPAIWHPSYHSAAFFSPSFPMDAMVWIPYAVAARWLMYWRNPSSISSHTRARAGLSRKDWA